MNNTQTLYLLIVVAALAGVGRLYTGHRFTKYDEALAKHKVDYKFIYETADSLEYRRSKVSVADSEAGYRSHFQNWALHAQMGTVRVETRENTQNNYVDRSFTVNFVGNEVFARKQIANFCFNSEGNMPRMRTTSLKLTPVPSDPRQRSVKPGEEREDIWKAEVTFTQRTPTAKKD